jgi:hypothetical protein
MDEIERHPIRLSESRDGDSSDYRDVSGLAVTGAILGLLSLSAIADTSFWPFAAAGILVCTAALWRIAARAPQLLGRKAAMVGLALSILAGTFAVGRTLTYEHLVQQQARQFGATWFQLMAERRPQLAHQLTLSPDIRKPLGTDLDAVYRDDETLRKALEKFTGEKLVQTLLALGEKAEVRYVATQSMDQPRGSEMLHQIYSVTHDEDGAKKTFYVDATLCRFPSDSFHGVNWVMLRAERIEAPPQ